MGDHKESLDAIGSWKAMSHVTANLRKRCFLRFYVFRTRTLFAHKIFHVWGILQSNKQKKLIHNVRIGRRTFFACSVCTWNALTSEKGDGVFEYFLLVKCRVRSGN